ncbi:hypothetical protein CkaCkLH20_07878 [Colletotrichum karsti]|uniref:BTB domain-containing protein n=1 Tax=Colletotrichum karsti TaxID=1095194 RepID=A0A9P6LJ22_9PEZI|nr:uncharacterized protein CkaCkLH20_07878 [Colletotrichum karsti]KAF9874741.1 hypothetical protein CkaCkLH20_07878 [Colletotrichum karsti]
MSLKRKRDMDELLTSRNITFIIGPDKVRYSVHEKSIAGLSDPLRALVTGPMRESIEAKVTWEDVEPAVFVNLMEYAYTGDFLILGCVDKNAPEGGMNNLSNEQKEASDQNKKAKKRDDKLPQSLFEAVVSAKKAGGIKLAAYQFTRKSFKCSKSCKFRITNDIQTIYNQEQIEASKKIIPCDLEHYMSLAKLYVLAEKYDISELKTLCASRFKHSIFHAPGAANFMDDMIFVLRYLSNLTRPKDQLRKVMLKYIITDLKWFMDQNCFRNLLQELPEVATELFLMIPSEYWQEVSRMC